MSEADKFKQVQSRERMKSLFCKLGGKQDSGSTDPRRSWRDRKGKRRRSVSPTRVLH